MLTYMEMTSDTRVFIPGAVDIIGLGVFSLIFFALGRGLMRLTALGSLGLGSRGDHRLRVARPLGDVSSSPG